MSTHTTYDSDSDSEASIDMPLISYDCPQAAHAMALPEILGRILSFLGPFSLFRARSVNRTWRTLADPVLEKTFVWTVAPPPPRYHRSRPHPPGPAPPLGTPPTTNSHSHRRRHNPIGPEEAALARKRPRLVECQILSFHFQPTFALPHRNDLTAAAIEENKAKAASAWSTLLHDMETEKHLQSTYRVQSQHQEQRGRVTLASSTLARLRRHPGFETILLWGQVDLRQQLIPLLDRCRSVTTLQIQSTLPGQLAFRTLIRCAPQLMHLTIGPQKDTSSRDYMVFSSSPSFHPRHAPKRPTFLKSLVLCRIPFAATVLSQIFGICPALEEFKAVDVWPFDLQFTTPPGSAEGAPATLPLPDEALYDRAALYETLKDSCPRLRSFMFTTRTDGVPGRGSSSANHSTLQELTLLALQTFPALQSFGCVDRDLGRMVRGQGQGQVHAADQGQAQTRPSDPSSSGNGGGLLQVVSTIANHLTTLEIWHVISAADHQNQILSGVLHDYLCQSPLLIHLKARNVIFFVEFFDYIEPSSTKAPGFSTSTMFSMTNLAQPPATPAPTAPPAAPTPNTDPMPHDPNHNPPVVEAPGQFDRRQFLLAQRLSQQRRSLALLSAQAIASTSTKDRKRLWRCRDLQTLHLGFGSRAPEDNEKGLPEEGRKLFQYLVKVCPRVKDAVLYRKKLDLSMESGLCFLMRWEGLERLEIRTQSVSVLEVGKDLCWLENRVRRWKKCDTEMEALVKEDEKVGQGTSEEKVSTGREEVQRFLVNRAVQQQYQQRTSLSQGHDQGIKVGYKTRDWCWPHLEQFRISRLGQCEADLDMIKSLRPELTCWEGGCTQSISDEDVLAIDRQRMTTEKGHVSPGGAGSIGLSGVPRCVEVESRTLPLNLYGAPVEHRGEDYGAMWAQFLGVEGQ